MSDASWKRENLRLALLRALEAGYARWGLPAGALRRLVLRWSAVPTAEEAEIELGYLQDKGLIQLVQAQVSPENRRWRITAAGRDFLAEQPDA